MIMDDIIDPVTSGWESYYDYYDYHYDYFIVIACAPFPTLPHGLPPFKWRTAMHLSHSRQASGNQIRMIILIIIIIIMLIIITIIILCLHLRVVAQPPRLRLPVQVAEAALGQGQQLAS